MRLFVCDAVHGAPSERVCGVWRTCAARAAVCRGAGPDAAGAARGGHESADELCEFHDRAVRGCADGRDCAQARGDGEPADFHVRAAARQRHAVETRVRGAVHVLGRDQSAVGSRGRGDAGSVRRVCRAHLHRAVAPVGGGQRGRPGRRARRRVHGQRKLDAGPGARQQLRRPVAHWPAVLDSLCPRGVHCRGTVAARDAVVRAVQGQQPRVCVSHVVGRGPRLCRLRCRDGAFADVDESFAGYRFSAGGAGADESGVV